jgi:hypothetical protein
MEPLTVTIANAKPGVYLVRVRHVRRRRSGKTRGKQRLVGKAKRMERGKP